MSEAMRAYDIPNIGRMPTPSWGREHPAYYEKDPGDYVEDCPQCGRERVYGFDDEEHKRCDSAT